MLEDKPVQSGVLRRVRSTEQWSVALAKRHDPAVVIKERDHLAVAPDAALIERLWGLARRLLRPLQSPWLAVPLILTFVLLVAARRVAPIAG